MKETWVEKKGWGRMKERTSGFRWEVQLASKKNKKERAIGGMATGVRNGIEVIKEVEEKIMEGIMKKIIKVGKKK